MYSTAGSNTTRSDVICISGCLKRRNNAKELDKLLQDLTIAEKAEIIFKNDKHVLWRKSGERGSSQMLEFLLHKCGADVDAPNDTTDTSGIDYSQTIYGLGRTPLLCAICAEHCFRVHKNVEVLVKNGAHLNALVDKLGENVNPSLIHACRYMGTHFCLVKFLIENGADVNLRNHEGLTALHYAASNGNKECIKVLLKNGAEYHWDHSVDVLPYAAMFDREETMEFLIKNTTQSDRVIADAYEVLGASNFLHDDHDMRALVVNRTSSVWKKAMQIRYNNKENPCLKSLPNGIKDIFQKEREPQTMHELGDVLSSVRSMSQQDLHLGIHSFLILERVIGEERPEYIDILDTHENWLQRNHKYTEVRLKFLKYAFNLCLKHDSPCYTVKSLLDTMTNYYLVKYKRGEKAVDFLNVLCDSLTHGTHLNTKLNHFKFEMMINIIVCLLSLLKENITWVVTPFAELSDRDASSYESDDLETYMCIKNYDPELTHNMEKLCTRMAKINPVDSDNCSMLHLSLDPRNVKPGRSFSSHTLPLPDLELTKLLIHSGFDVNWRDCDGNTIMMKLIKNFSVKVLDDRYLIPDIDVIAFLLDFGVHGDIRNKYGETAMDMMRKKVEGYKLVKKLMDVFEEIKLQDKMISLQCIAARKLTNSGVPYENYAPVGIISFIDMHNKYKSSVYNKK